MYHQIPLYLNVSESFWIYPLHGRACARIHQNAASNHDCGMCKGSRWFGCKFDPFCRISDISHAHSIPTLFNLKKFQGKQNPINPYKPTKPSYDGIKRSSELQGTSHATFRHLLDYLNAGVFALSRNMTCKTWTHLNHTYIPNAMASICFDKLTFLCGDVWGITSRSLL
jgi:hypothetical protein